MIFLFNVEEIKKILKEDLNKISLNNFFNGDSFSITRTAFKFKYLSDYTKELYKKDDKIIICYEKELVKDLLTNRYPKEINYILKDNEGYICLSLVFEIENIINKKKPYSIKFYDKDFRSIEVGNFTVNKDYLKKYISDETIKLIIDYHLTFTKNKIKNIYFKIY